MYQPSSLPLPRASASSEGTAALDKALDVLDAVGDAPQGLSQVALAKVLGLPRTTLYRLLATLVARRLLRRDPRRMANWTGWSACRCRARPIWLSAGLTAQRFSSPAPVTGWRWTCWRARQRRGSC